MNWDGRIRADARQIPLADSCVQCVITSPPYFGLRDYGNTEQIGLEKTPQEYVETLVHVFREVWRVLKADGVAWLNLGDSYNNRTKVRTTSHQPALNNFIDDNWSDRAKRGGVRMSNIGDGIKEKDLIGIPWRVAFALQADGWYLRSDIIWSKSNPMPESVTDRCTKAHEYIFLLTKSERYFYDADAISEPLSETTLSRFSGVPMRTDANGLDTIARSVGNGSTRTLGAGDDERRNKRTVWNVATQPYPEAHYATFPEEIPETCIRAGSRPGDLVLDPFFGSGTVGRVAERLSRRWVGLDLGYQDLQEKRLRNVQRELVGLGVASNGW